MVNPLKFNEDFLIFILLWHKEILGIFVIPTNIPSNISLAGTLLSTRLTQHCIMWQSHRISSLIPGKTPAYPILVKINFLHTVNCSFLKSLSLNQLLFRHSRSASLSGQPLRFQPIILHSQSSNSLPYFSPAVERLTRTVLF